MGLALSPPPYYARRFAPAAAAARSGDGDIRVGEFQV